MIALPPAAIGRIVVEATLDVEKEKLTIKLDQGELVGQTDAECCSHTWVEHLTIPVDAAGATITGYTESDPVEDESDDYVKIYHAAIQTTRGEIIIEYRNESNGYYGGWMDWSLT